RKCTGRLSPPTKQPPPYRGRPQPAATVAVLDFDVIRRGTCYGIRKTRILLAVARHSLRESVLGNWIMASATDADPVRKHRQPPVHLENFLVGPRMGPRLAVCGRSRADGVGPRLPKGNCAGTTRSTHSDGSGFLVGYVAFHVWTRHGPEPVGPRRTDHPKIHLPEAASGPLRPDRI